MPVTLSSYARLLLDYSSQAAKQRRHATVQPLHVALAMVERERARAELEWGSLVADVEAAALRLTTGTATPVVTDATMELLARVADKGDEWEVMHAELPTLLRAADHPDDTPVPAPPAVPPDEARVAGPQPPPASGASAVAETFEAMRSMGAAVRAARTTGVRWRTKDEGEHAVLDDLWSLFQLLASADGRWDEAELSLLRDFFGDRAVALPDVRAGGGAAAGSMTAVLEALHAADAARGTHDAERYARAMVRLGQVICAADSMMGLEEARGLDDLRMRFRGVLGADRGNDRVPALVGNDVTNDALGELASLVGLEDVKSEILAFTQLTAVNKLRLARGQAATLPTLHMAFLGNPGTGKTTVARILGRILAGLGVLSRGHFVEVDRTDLIAQYVGQTAPKVHGLIERARGGVLFIDEAYSLAGGRRGEGYEHEAVDTLMKLMEDLRHEIVVIVAGYPDLMSEFFGSNPGIRARIATHLYFSDYDLDQLMQIFDGFCVAQGRVCPGEARAAVRKLLDVMRVQPRFGNGRDVRNVFEVLERRLAARVAPLGDLATDEELRTFSSHDVPTVPPKPDDAAYL